jgi:hypothetical protein
MCGKGHGPGIDFFINDVTELNDVAGIAGPAGSRESISCYRHDGPSFLHE